MNANMIVPSAKTLLSAAGSAAAAAMLLRSVARDYIPQELRFFVLSKLRSLLSSITFQLTLIVDEYDALSHNHLFRAAELYIQPSLSPVTNRFRATMPQKEEKISLTMERNEEIVDTFRGVHFRWRFVSKPIASKYVQAPGQEAYSLYKSELRHFELRFHKRHKALALDLYLPHVIQQSKRFEEEKKTLKIFTLRSDRLRGRRGDSWQSVVLDHPATFETVAMEAEMKKTVVEDLERFVKRREMYRRVGKAWKRGYLLFGPPGTGKSSLIAAMANYLNFDVYDLELTDIRKNSDLRKLLIATANRSILVVEDIDCSLELRDRDRLAEVGTFYPYHFTSGTEVTLSGFLNFIDGLWSSCGDERIIVFTTNHKEKLDPALLRPGRMDVHIHMSYCTPSGFKVLASNYLGITHHSLFSVIEEFIATMKVTPAEIGEHLMKSDEPEIALRGLIEFLEEKRRSDDETRVKEAKSEQEDEKKDERNNHCEEGIQNMIKIGVEACKSKC